MRSAISGTELRESAWTRGRSRSLLMLGIATAIAFVGLVHDASAAEWKNKVVQPVDYGTLNDVSCTRTICEAVGALEPRSKTPTPIQYEWKAGGGEWWTQLTPPTGSVPQEDVSCAPLPARCMSVPASGVKSEFYNGTKWAMAPLVKVSEDMQISDVSCAESACVATGSYESGKKMLAEVWNGSFWTVQSPKSEAALNSLDSVSCVSATNCTAVGKQGEKPVALRWNGSGWSTLSAPSATITSSGNISCLLNKECMTVSGTDTVGQELWTPTSVWTTYTGPAPGEGAALTGVSCQTPTACFAVGSYVDSSTKRLTALAEVWNGTGWTTQTTPIYVEKTKITGVSCLTGQGSICVAVGVKGVGGVEQMVSMVYE